MPAARGEQSRRTCRPAGRGRFMGGQILIRRELHPATGSLRYSHPSARTAADAPGVACAAGRCQPAPACASTAAGGGRLHHGAGRCGLLSPCHDLSDREVCACDPRAGHRHPVPGVPGARDFLCRGQQCLWMQRGSDPRRCCPAQSPGRASRACCTGRRLAVAMSTGRAALAVPAALRWRSVRRTLTQDRAAAPRSARWLRQRRSAASGLAAPPDAAGPRPGRALPPRPAPCLHMRAVVSCCGIPAGLQGSLPPRQPSCADGFHESRAAGGQVIPPAGFVYR